MLTEDRFIQMINRVLAALASILHLKTAGQLLAARQVVEEVLESLFGLRVDLLRRLDDEAVLDALTFQGELDVGRTQAAAALFKADGDLWASQGNDALQQESYGRALLLYLESARAGGAPGLPDPVEEIEGLIEALLAIDLPVDLRYPVFCYLEDEGAFARAERMLLSLHEDPASAEAVEDELLSFYDRLLGLSDAQLTAGGVGREQIELRRAKWREGGQRDE